MADDLTMRIARFVQPFQATPESFKVPSAGELDQDYPRRYQKSPGSSETGDGPHAAAS